MIGKPPISIFADFPAHLDADILHAKLSSISGLFVVKHELDGAEVVELVLDGMSFNLLVNAEKTVADQSLNRESMTDIFLTDPNIDASRYVSLAFGSHIKGGKVVRPIIVNLLRLAQIVGRVFSAKAIFWTPANHLIGFDHYSDSIDQFANGGPFPVLSLVGINKKAEHSFVTDGLFYFSQQEIEFRVADGMTDAEAIKRLVRVVHEVAVNGAIREEVEVSGMVPNEHIFMRPDQDDFSRPLLKVGIVS